MLPISDQQKSVREAAARALDSLEWRPADDIQCALYLNNSTLDGKC